MPVQTVIKVRRDTAANWTSTNPVLAAGEMGLEADTDLFKFGNGTSTWAELVYPAASTTTYLVRNNTGSTIPKGTLVAASGAEPSGRIDVAPFEVTGLEDSELRVMGVATANISTGQNGTVMSFGTLKAIDTRGTSASAIAVGDETWAEGDILYAHPTVDGKLTNVRPQHDLAIAFITVRHASSGQIAVRIVPGNNHLEWMHDVSISSPSNSQALVYDSTAGLWKNGSIDVPNSGWQTITVSDASPNVTLTAASPLETRITGTLAAAGIAYLPDCTTLQVGDKFIVRNNTSLGGGSLGTMYSGWAGGGTATIQPGAHEYTCIDNSTAGTSSNWQRVSISNGNINGTGLLLGTTNPGLVVPTINGAVEPFVAANGNQTFDAATPIRISLAPTANMTVNFRYSSTQTLASNPAFVVNRSITFVYMVKNGATPYYPTSWSMDGTPFTPKWLGGTAPSAGNANATDVYTITIMRTGTSTYEYFGSVSKFA